MTFIITINYFITPTYMMWMIYFYITYSLCEIILNSVKYNYNTQLNKWINIFNTFIFWKYKQKYIINFKSYEIRSIRYKISANYTGFLL